MKKSSRCRAIQVWGSEERFYVVDTHVKVHSTQVLCGIMEGTENSSEECRTKRKRA